MKKRVVLLIGVIIAIGCPCFIYFSNKKLFDQNGYLIVWLLIIAVLLIAIALLICCFALKKPLKIHIIFLIASLFLGTAYLIVLPPSSVPDELTHYVQSFYEADKLMNDDHTESNMIYMDNDYYQYSFGDNMYTTLNTYKAITEKFNDNLDNTADIKTGINVNPTYNILFHLPSTIGILIGRVVDMSYIQILYFASFFSLIWYSILCSLAIKLIPFGKGTMAITALFPLSLQLAGSFSYDSTIISLYFLTTAYILYLAYRKEKVTFFDWLVLGGITVLVAPIKNVYVFISLLCFLIPKSKFRKPYISILFKMTLIVLNFCILGNSIFSVILGKINTYGTSGSDNIAFMVDGYEWEDKINTYGTSGSDNMLTYSITYLLDNPIESIRLFGYTFLYKLVTGLPLAIGMMSGVIDIRISFILILVFIVLLFLSISSRDIPIPFIKIRRLSMLICFLTISIIFCVYAVAETPMHSTLIQGIQGRYFTPFIPLIFFILYNKKIPPWHGGDFEKWLLYAIILANIPVIYQIFNTIINR